MVSWDFESNDGMSGGTPCRIQLCVPKPRGSLQTCVNFDILWFFLKFSYSIPIKKPKVWDLVIWWFAWLLHCKAKLLRFGTSQENWWFGTWNLEKLRRSWVNFGVDTWHLTLWMHFGWWSAQGNHIPYHGNGSDFQLKSVETVNDSFWETQVSWPRWYLQYIWMQTYCIMNMTHTVWHII